MSRAAHALHGGPDSSHWKTWSVGVVVVVGESDGGRYLHLADAARVAGLPQAVRLGVGGVLPGVQRGGVVEALRTQAGNRAALSVCGGGGVVGRRRPGHGWPAAAAHR